jgi:HK97 family phage major capsid protein
MKYGINKQYVADHKDSAAPIADPAETKDAIMKELVTIKGALEKNLNDKAVNQQKNLDEKIEVVNATIEELKNKKPEVTAEELKAIKDDLDVTIKALDVLQSRQKSQKATGTHYEAPEDFSLKAQIHKGFESFKDNISKGKIAAGDNVAPLTVKAVGDMTIAANLTTGNLPNTYRSGIVGQPYEMVHLRDLVVVTPSATDSYHFYRHNVGEGAINWQVQELATKQQIDENLAEQTVNLDYLAGWLRISRKMLRNFSGLQAYITRWLPEKYYQVEDTKGYQALISAATGVADSSGTDTISVIIRTIGLQKKAKYNVNGIVVDGVTWARILTYKASTSGEFTMPIGVVSISPSGVLMICGVPVYVASWVGGDEAIIGDWRYFEIIQSEGLSLQFFEQDGTNVRENKITVRIEASVGFAMLDPLAFVVASLESVS